MPRSMIETNQAYFRPLSEEIAQGSGRVIDTSKARCIKTGSEESKSVIKNALVLDSFECVASGQYLLFSYNSALFLVARSSLLPDDIEPESAISEVEMHGGFLTLLLSHFSTSIHINCTHLEAYDILTAHDESASGCVFYECEDILNIIGPAKVYSIRSDFSQGSFLLYRIVGLLLLMGGRLKIKLDPWTTTQFESYFYEQHSSCPHDNLVHALLATRWNHAFLEVYRCVELLYPVKRIRDLKLDIGVELTIPKLYRCCFEKLGWKPHEDQALEDLISETSGWEDYHHDSIKKYVPKPTVSSVARFIYSRRNECVHFRRTDSTVSINDELGNALLRFLLYIAKAWQDVYIDDATCNL